MNEKTFQRLEFRKVLDLLAERTSFALSREMAMAIQPSTNMDTVAGLQLTTSQARTLLDKVGEVNIGGLRDIRGYISEIERARTLDSSGYLEIRDSLRALSRLGQYFRGLDPLEYPVFADIGWIITDFDHIVSEISRIFDDSGEVKDSASPQLRSIRSQVKVNQQRVRDKLNSLISSGEYQKHLQDNLVAVRGDRYVIPVKAESKSHVPGVVHDRSSSGATLFIEPMAVVEINNTLRELQLAETQEILRLLRELNQKISGVVGEMKTSLAAAADADLLLAKGRLSQDQRGTKPKINQNGRFSLRKARHPLLGKDVVPVDVQAGDKYRILVITGPNTGGKTVTLKTVGLMSLMAQSGLQLPVDEGSEVAVFQGVYCDIGDEQSIEQNLSTFSGHVSNISSILREMADNSLVLLDELGAGTDPQEGAALAVAILDYLLHKQCTAIVTTHFSELKTYAYSHTEIENASMEFDAQSLSPTYRVILGLPGKSNALEIATRLGLPQEVIDRARQARAGLQTELDEVLGEIGEELKLTRRARQDAETAQEEAKKFREKYAKLTEEFEANRKNLMAKAKREAQVIVSESRAELENAVKEIMETRTDEVIKAGRRTLEGISKRIRSTASDTAHYEQDQVGEPAKLQVGSKVYVRSLRSEGEIVELNKARKEVLVQAGALRVSVPFKDLAEPAAPKSGRSARKSGPSVTRVIREKQMSVPSELMVRGMTVEHAWSQLDKFLDDAMLAGYESIRLIHGKGEGILRSQLRQRLQGHPAVRGFEEAAYNQGGSGVTVVYLKH